MRSPWSLFLPRTPIRVRIVAAVVVAMTVVLLAAGGFVYWRVGYALDRQLDQDLRAYADLVTREVQAGHHLPADNSGEVSQVYAADGSLAEESDRGVPRLLTGRQVAGAVTTPKRVDLGGLIPPAERPYRVRYFTTTSPSGPVVVAAAISRRKHDEALRELLLQLGLADLATVLAAGVVGWGATRAALGPVERYRRAAAAAGGDPSRRLPVEIDRDDELTRLGTTFNALLAEIEQGQARERQFLADASHELRSPLALMAAEVEWARHRPRSQSELSRVLESLGDQTQRLVDLSNALLDLEEVDGAPAARKAVVPLDQLLAGAVVAPADLARAAGRDLVVHAPAAPVRVDRRWMELAVANLVANAVKHGQATITVTGEVTTDRARIRVTDEGPGIPPELGDKAFDRFTRADTTRSTPGSGLGLALVRSVALRHDGVVRLVPGGVEIELPSAVQT